MILPNIDKAVIEPEKLRDYLLSKSHPIGRFKAEFFRSTFDLLDSRIIIGRLWRQRFEPNLKTTLK